ncbi:MAG: hypothetical protein ACQER7_14765 [Bacteroidota bacterium]
MKRLLLYITLALFLFACQAERESTAVRYPDPPNQPPRRPSGPAVVIDHAMPPHPDKDEDENEKERKEDGSNRKPSRDEKKDKDKDDGRKRK